MLHVSTTAEFDVDIRRLKRQGKDLSKLWSVVEILATGEPLDDAFRDHQLTGRWAGVRELHIEFDWLLAYQVRRNSVRLIRTGTHADLFGH